MSGAVRVVAAALILAAAAGCARRAGRPRARAARAPDCSTRTDYEIGYGRADITGPIADVGMMGYANPDQRTAGLELRLYSRAFVVASPCTGKRIVFVSADLGQMFQGVREAAVRSLAARFPDGRYHTGNVMLSATHTHGGPGGYSQSRFYNITTFGHHRRNFEGIVSGILRSIVRADASVGTGRVRLATGTVEGASANRSREAYLQNPEEERRRYAGEVDGQMALLRLERDDGTAAALNWFAVHGTSMSNRNRLVTGDNKGLAALLMERSQPDCSASPVPVVAAFAQGNAGDVTPNVYPPDGRAGDERVATARNARAQYARACALYAAAASAEPLAAVVDYRTTFVRFDQVDLGGGHRTCAAAIGASMLAGAEDGRGLPGFQEGMTCDSIGFLGRLLYDCHSALARCQAGKPIVLTTGDKDPPWTPAILPVQVFRIGPLAIVGVPFEITTMAGRRLRETTLQRLRDSGVTTVAVASLSNAYAGYVTTPEEYAVQHYEGASTHFGPWTLPALQRSIGELAGNLASGAPADPGPPPLSVVPPHEIDPRPRFDALPQGRAFGQVLRDARERYRVGDTVEVSFWAGHPANEFRAASDGTFFRVEHEADAGWQEIARDGAWAARLEWQVASCQGPCPDGGAASVVTISWPIGAATVAGRHRIVHQGDARDRQGVLTPYSGTSRVFTVELAGP